MYYRKGTFFFEEMNIARMIHTHTRPIGVNLHVGYNKMTDLTFCHFLPFKKSHFLPPNSPAAAKKPKNRGVRKNAVRFFNG
jgi:hypothetical protein